MKKLLTIALLIIGFSASAQTKVTKDASGNYQTVKKAADTSKAVQVAIFTDSKGKAWPVYKSASGALYALRVSAKGNTYKAYLKEQ